MNKDFQIHPFDLSYDQINKHRKQYKAPKGALANSFPIAKSSLQDVFVALSQKIQLHPEIWKNILKQFDQSMFDINFSQEDFQSKFHNAQDQREFKQFQDDSEKWNLAKQQDLILLASKIEFSDFLKAIQRESILRDILSEHQMYYHSIKRMLYKQETKLINKQATEAIKSQKQNGSAKTKISSVTHLIDNMLMFTNQNCQLLLVAFENQVVQVYEAGTGYWIYEFTFYDNIFECSKNGHEVKGSKSSDEKAIMLEKEFKKSGLTRAEFNLQKRKVAQDRGEYTPEIPPYTKVVRTHFHMLNQKQNLMKNCGPEALKLEQQQSQIAGQLDNFLVGLGGNKAKVVKRKENEFYYEEKDNNLSSDDSFQSRSRSPRPRWERLMNERTEKSMRGSNRKFRDCCSHNELNFMTTGSFLQASITENEFRQRNMRELNRGKSAGIGIRRQINKNFDHMQSVDKIEHNEHVKKYHGKDPKKNFIFEQNPVGLKVKSALNKDNSEIDQYKNPQRRVFRTHKKLFDGLRAQMSQQMVVELSAQSSAFTKKSVDKQSKYDKKFIKDLQNAKTKNEMEKEMMKTVISKGSNKDLRLSNLRKSEGLSVTNEEDSDFAQSPMVKKSIKDRGAEFQKKSLTRDQYCALKKQERIEQAQAQRKLIHQRRENPNKKKLYGILGQDSLISQDELANTGAITDVTTNKGEHAYGLDHRLFTGKGEQIERKQNYDEKIKRVDIEINGWKKYLKNREQNFMNQGIPLPPTEYRDVKDTTTEEIQKAIDTVLKKRNKLYIQIQEVTECKDFYDEVYQELQQLCNIVQIRLDKEKGELDVFYDQGFQIDKNGKIVKDRLTKKAVRNGEDDDNLQGKVKDKNLIKIRQKAEKDRDDRVSKIQAEMKQASDDTFKLRKKKDKKTTYPVCMQYFEPHNIAVFGLVSKELQIHQFKQTGTRRSFQHVQSMRVEHMIISLTVEQHKGSNNIIVCAGTQSKKKEKSEVAVFILDPRLDFEVLQSYRWIWPVPDEQNKNQEQQITQVYYKGGCGLIICSFTGFIEIYDAINVNHSVWDNGKTKAKSGGGSISTVCYSEVLDIIAYAGVSGKIYVLDQTTKNPNGQIQAHKGEVIMLSFYDQQHQLISVSQTGEVGLWDAQKLTKIQIMRNGSNMTQKIISACSFYEQLGKIQMATTKIFNYDLQIDQDVKIKTDQGNAVARDYLRQFHNQLIQSGIITGEESQLRKRKVDFDIEGKKAILSEAEYMNEAYKDKALKDLIPSGLEYNASVLASVHSKLVGIIMDKVKFQLYTVDSDLMVRVWDCQTNKCLRSYSIETRDDQIAEANQKMNNEGGNPYEKVERKRAQIVRSDVDIKFLLVAFEAGEIQVNNLFTGALIYNNSNVRPIKIENEITNMKFFNSQTKFWIAASCWEGKVAFVTRPQVTQGRNFLKFKKCKCSHKRDVISLDINSENQLVTASMDNIICFWNSFNGVESKKVVLPNEIADLTKGQTVSYVKFPFEDKKDILMVIINNGDCFILETQSEKFLEFNQQTIIKNNSIDELGSAGGSDIDSLNSIVIDDGIVATNTSSIHRSSIESIPAEKSDRYGSSQRKVVNLTKLTTSKYLLGKIATHPTIDISEGYLVSISENGKGMLHSMKMNVVKKNKWDLAVPTTNKQEFNMDQNPILFEEIHKFKVCDTLLETTNPVFMVSIEKEHDIIVVGQLKGTVTIMSLLTCEILGILNQGIVNLPIELTEEQPDDPKVKVNKLVKAQKLAKDIYHFKKYQTKQAPWNTRLANSEVGTKKFHSEVLNSVWQSRGVKSEYNRKNKQALPKNTQGAISSRINIVNVDSLTNLDQNNYQTIQAEGIKQPINFYGGDVDSSIQGGKQGTQYGKTVGGSTNDGTTIQ